MVSGYVHQVLRMQDGALTVEVAGIGGARFEHHACGDDGVVRAGRLAVNGLGHVHNASPLLGRLDVLPLRRPHLETREEQLDDVPQTGVDAEIGVGLGQCGPALGALLARHQTEGRANALLAEVVPTRCRARLLAYVEADSTRQLALKLREATEA